MTSESKSRIEELEKENEKLKKEIEVLKIEKYGDPSGVDEVTKDINYHFSNLKEKGRYTKSNFIYSINNIIKRIRESKKIFKMDMGSGCLSYDKKFLVRCLSKLYPKEKISVDIVKQGMVPVDYEISITFHD